MRLVNSAALAPTLPYPIVNGYVSVIEITPAQDGGLVPVQPPELTEGNHFSYAIQWFSFAGMAGVGTGRADPLGRPRCAAACGTACRRGRGDLMRKLWLASLGIVAVLTACSSTTPAGPAATPAPTLEGTSWTVTAINGTAPITGNAPTMEFTDAAVTGSASCNRYNAAFTQDGSKVTITPGVTTAMACGADVMSQEHAFTVALTQVSGARTTGEGAELTDGAERPCSAWPGSPTSRSRAPPGR